LWFYVIRFRIKETKARVKRALPNKTDKEVNQIAFDSIYNLILTFFELSYRAFDKRHIYKYTEVKNIDFLKKCLEGDRPVFLFTGHLANGEIILSRVCYEGVELHLIAKRVKNLFLDSLLFEAREVSGLKHIPPKNALSEIIECMRKKAPLVFLHDQYMRPPKGVKTTFLDLPVFTNPSVAKFALKNNAMVLPVNLYRENSKTVVEFEEEIPLEKNHESFEENVVHMTQVYNDWLSEKVKKRPSEWMWVHRRFKVPGRQT
jgi:KDO2-lipid IV(A) lauroyltransferase